MGKRRERRVYSRQQGGQLRYYGDFRDNTDVGGKREALIPEGAGTATTDEKLAQLLASQRLAELEDRRRRKSQGEPEEDALLARFAAYHLREKASCANTTGQWLEAAQMHLEAAIAYFCNSGRPIPRDREGRVDLSSVTDRALVGISTRNVQQYRQWLAARDNGRGGTLSPSSQRKYLNSLSNLFRRASAEEHVRVNPCREPRFVGHFGLTH